MFVNVREWIAAIRAYTTSIRNYTDAHQILPSPMNMRHRMYFNGDAIEDENM